MKQTLFIIKKDLLTELRKRESLVSMIFFGFLILVILNIAAGVDRKLDISVSGGILWVAIVFSAVLGLNRLFSQENENRCIDGLLLSPVQPESIFLAKVTVNFIFMLLAEFVLIPLFFVLYDVEFTRYLPGLVVVVLFLNLGFSSVGTLISAISSGTRKAEVILPILLFPVLIPLITAAVKATGELFGGDAAESYSKWLYLTGAFDLIFFGSSYLLFEHVIKEK